MKHSPLFEDARPFRVQRFFTHKRFVIGAGIVLGVAACGAVLGPGFLAASPHHVNTVASPSGSAQNAVRSGLQDSGSEYQASAGTPSGVRPAGGAAPTAPKVSQGSKEQGSPSPSPPPFIAAAARSVAVRASPCGVPGACADPAPVGAVGAVQSNGPSGPGRTPAMIPAGPTAQAPRPRATAVRTSASPTPRPSPQPTPQPSPTGAGTPPAPTAPPTSTVTGTVTPTATATPLP